MNNMASGGTSRPTHSHLHDVIRFSMKELSEIACMDDFYKNTCLIGLCQHGLIADVQQIWMNAEQCAQLNDLCKKNARQLKKYKHLSDDQLENSVAMDWLCYAPVSVPYVPENEIWIWSTENYKQTMDEYRLWLRENPQKEIISW